MERPENGAPFALHASMAFLSALLSLVARQLTTILQAIFGWSITALFGKLPPKQQIALSAALLLSVVWPFLLLGCFFPAAAAWAIAFVPLHRWASDFALRIVWISLAVLVPLGVGGLTYWISPKDQLKKGAAGTVFGGYAITLGYSLAFFITALTVPVVKILSTMRRWDDTHVYIQAKEGRYQEVLDLLTKACEKADVKVVREDVPKPMALATKVIRKLTGPFVDPHTADELQRLRGKDLEVYLYPADLLLRGEAHKVAHVRAAMTRTDLEGIAYLVESPDARKLQDEIGGLTPNGEGPSPVDGQRNSEMVERVCDIAHRLDRLSIPFDEWNTLEALLRRHERKALGERDLLEEASDGQGGKARDAQQAREEQARRPASNTGSRNGKANGRPSSPSHTSFHA